MSDDLAPLVERSRRGDMEAFGALVAETEAYVYNLAYRILGNVQEAEDMTQDVFVRVWRALPEFRADCKFTTWLYRIVMNTSLNRQRQLRAELQIVDHTDALDDLALPKETSDADPSAAAIDRETVAALWAAVERLSAKYRLVIALFYQEGLSYEEIAELLALPLGTVKSHLNRARCALGKVLRTRKESHHASL
jgi:RNA polymerase sigma-70 factor, ECF subfamily